MTEPTYQDAKALVERNNKIRKKIQDIDQKICTLKKSKQSLVSEFTEIMTSYHKVFGDCNFIVDGRLLKIGLDDSFENLTLRDHGKAIIIEEIEQ